MLNQISLRWTPEFGQDNFQAEGWSHRSQTREKEPVAEFKEFERRFKFKPRFKYGWFHLKLYQMFQDLNRRLI